MPRKDQLLLDENEELNKKDGLIRVNKNWRYLESSKLLFIQTTKLMWMVMLVKA